MKLASSKTAILSRGNLLNNLFLHQRLCKIETKKTSQSLLERIKRRCFRSTLATTIVKQKSLKLILEQSRQKISNLLKRNKSHMTQICRQVNLSSFLTSIKMVVTNSRFRCQLSRIWKTMIPLSELIERSIQTRKRIL